MAARRPAPRPVLAPYRLSLLAPLPRELVSGLRRFVAMGGPASDLKKLRLGSRLVEDLREFERDWMIYSESIDRSLAERGISGSHPDPELAWERAGEGYRRSVTKALEKRDARAAAIAIARLTIEESLSGARHGRA